MVGTILSVFIRLELSEPGSKFLAGNHQLYNVLPFSAINIKNYFKIIMATLFIIILYISNDISVASTETVYCPSTLFTAYENVSIIYPMVFFISVLLFIYTNTWYYKVSQIFFSFFNFSKNNLKQSA